MNKWNHYFLILIIIFLSSCKTDQKESKPSEEYIASMETYWSERQEGRTTYLQLTALHPLRDSVMTFGTSNENDLVIQSDGLAEIIGKYTIANDSIYFESTDTVKVTDGKDEIISNLKFAQADVADSPKLHHNHLNWMVILRSGGLYLRVWDENNPFVESFKGFERFDLSTKSIYEGTFTYYEAEKEEEVHSQLGLNASTKFIGSVEFDHDGKMYTLDVGQSGFTMVNDKTSGDLTYGGGRYIYLDLPDSDGPVTIDFNKLYNPPCSFSKYTTCLYPPKQNHLPFAILAGETITDL